MSKYRFDKLGGETFEQLAQALLEARRRGYGNLIQFATAGSDGAREATWSQPPQHPEYTRPTNAQSDIPKEWIFQAKFHDIGLRGWRGAADAIVTDLKAELKKLTANATKDFHRYVLITNVPLSGAKAIGSRDQVTEIAEIWSKKIPEIEVWDAADVSRMLDNNSEVRKAYSELILPGDILAAIHQNVTWQTDRRANSFRGYLSHIVKFEAKARADEAGDEDQLSLSKVFIDQKLKLDVKNLPACYNDIVMRWQTGPVGNCRCLPISLDEVHSTFALLSGAPDKSMLLAGPGYGKSTITQFLALYHSCRIIDRIQAKHLAKRIHLPPHLSPDHLDSLCPLRYPFRIELRRYAKWRRSAESPGIAAYIAGELIGKNVESSLSQEDIFHLANHNPTLLILDGLDEVPNREIRDSILQDFDAFINRCNGESADLQIIMSSRPQGYNGEFDRFQPLRWTINDLKEDDFNSYCNLWLSERIRNAEERSEAEEKIKRGMLSPAVKRLATTLLQATVMLTIVRRRSDIPEERHKLFEKYVDVVFQREKSKVDLVSRYEPELRRLHEIVGYRLHEAVGRGDDGKLPAARFKQYVIEVWQILRGNEHFSGIPNQEFSNIVELATDRLVFLSGQGESQTDIDFVIQPYREYFAAQYLSLHTAAAPDRVYDCLVERGAFWVNVLQFYVAVATPAQQLAWISRGSDLASGKEGVQKFPIRSQHDYIVVNSLPENTRFSSIQFRRALITAFDAENLWIWLGHEWMWSIIRTVRGGEAARILYKELVVEKLLSHRDLWFVLWFFPQVLLENTEQRDHFVNLVKGLLESKEEQRAAILTILAYDLPISLDHLDRELFTTLAEDPHTANRMLRSSFGIDTKKHQLPRSLMSRMIWFGYALHRLGSRIGNIWKFIGVSVQVKEMNVTSSSEPSGKPYPARRPLWTRVVPQDQPALPLNSESKDVRDKFEVYFACLKEAIESPNDADLYLMAEKQESALPNSSYGLARCQSLLGPTPSDFFKNEDWQNFRAFAKQLTENSNDLDDIRKFFQVADHEDFYFDTTGLVLLFHPADWDSLVSLGLTDAESVSAIMNSPWGKISALPKKFIELVEFEPEFVYWRSDVAIKVDDILKAAISANSHCRLGNSFLLWRLLASSTFRLEDEEECFQCVMSCDHSANLPPVWAAFFLMVGLLAVKAEPARILALWQKIGARLLREKQLCSAALRRSSFKMGEFITSAIERKNYSALNFIIEMTEIEDLQVDLSSRLNEFIVERLARLDLNIQNERLLIDGLLDTSVTLREIALVAESDWLCGAAQKFQWLNTRIAERFEHQFRFLDKAHLPEARRYFTLILGRRTSFAPVIAAAALSAIIQIDVLTQSPLNEEMWQMDSATI